MNTNLVPLASAAVLWRPTLKLAYIGLSQVPMLWYARPQVLHLDDTSTVVRIRLRRRTRNHLGSMYFGAFAVGADCTGGILAMHHIGRSSAPISIIFKDFHADFLSRAMGDVHFHCQDGAAVAAAVARTASSGQRENVPLQLLATVPEESATEPVARFTLTMSLKAR